MLSTSVCFDMRSPPSGPQVGSLQCTGAGKKQRISEPVGVTVIEEDEEPMVHGTEMQRLLRQPRYAAVPKAMMSREWPKLCAHR